MTTRVALCGANGRMGNLILEEIKKAPDLELVAGFDVVGEGKALIGDVKVSNASRLSDVLAKTLPDVLIDFTIAPAATENVCTAAACGVNLVVGTTGFSEEQKKKIHGAIAGGKVAAVISPNYMLGMNVFWKLLAVAAEVLRDYDVEIIEAHHNQKKDAPSGTALAALDVLKATLGKDEVVYGRKGLALRGKEIGVHAIRAGDIVGDHTVLFAGPGERLEIKHQAHSRVGFAAGAVRAAGWVARASPGVYTMADVLHDQA